MKISADELVILLTLLQRVQANAQVAEDQLAHANLAKAIAEQKLDQYIKQALRPPDPFEYESVPESLAERENHKWELP